MGHWSLGLLTCLLWTGSDVFLSTTSIMHLGAIAIHRYLAISHPVRMRSLQEPRHVVALLTPAWTCSFCISLPLVVQGWYHEEHVLLPADPDPGQVCGIFDFTFAVYSSVVSFFLPLTIMVVADVRSVQILRNNQSLGGGMVAHRRSSATPTTSHDLSRGASSKDTSLYELSNPTSPTSPCEPKPRTSELKPRPQEPKTRLGESQCYNGEKARHVKNSHANKRAHNDVTVPSVITPMLEAHESAMNDLGRGGSDPHDLHAHDQVANSLRRNDFTRNLRPPECDEDINDRDTLLSPPGRQGAPPRDRKTSRLRRSMRATSMNYFAMLADRGVAKMNSREKRAEKTLFVVFICFVTFWCPFFVTNLTYGICRDSCHIPPTLFQIFTWLGYISSGVNPIIYSMLNRDFRRAFSRILCLQRKPNGPTRRGNNAS